MNLTNCQKLAVQQLLNKYHANVKCVSFKAPTGAGKTLIACEFIARCFKASRGLICCVIATLSSAKLPQQFLYKIEKYKNSLSFKNFAVELIQSPSRNKTTEVNPKIIAANRKIILFGKSSFGKRRILSETQEIDSFLLQIKHEQIKLLYIRDEAHIGDNHTMNIIKNFETKLQQNADFVLKMTATPTDVDVEITEEQIKDDGETNKAFLLKTTPSYNDFSTNEAIDYQQLTDKALVKFIEIKQEYKNHHSKHFMINPALLIQVSPKTQNNKSFDDDIKTIIRQIKSHNLHYVKYFGECKESDLIGEIILNEISANDSLIDVIIFKTGPATGWDIPRACMILQLRNICSEKFNIQTIGRIKRNPHPHLAFDKIYDKYYIFSNFHEQVNNLKSFRLKKSFASVKLIRGIIKGYQKKPQINTAKIREYLFKLECTNYFSNEIDNIIKHQQINVNRVLYTSKTETNVVVEKLTNQIQLNSYLINQWPTNWNLHLNELIAQLIAKNSQKYNELYIRYLLLADTSCRDKINKLIENEMMQLNKSAQYIIEPNVVLVDNFTVLNAANSVEANMKSFAAMPYYCELPNATNKKEETTIVLDSGSEERFAKNICHLIETSEKGTIPVELWLKNAAPSNKIYFEYINSTGIHKSYIDFVFKNKNNYLCIEIKHETSFDPQKIKTLRREYPKYYSQNSKNKIFFGVCTYRKDINNNRQFDLEILDSPSELRKDYSITDALKLIK